VCGHVSQVLLEGTLGGEDVVTLVAVESYGVRRCCWRAILVRFFQRLTLVAFDVGHSPGHYEKVPSVRSAGSL